jgi:hypothetical protein
MRLRLVLVAVALVAATLLAPTTSAAGGGPSFAVELFPEPLDPFGVMTVNMVVTGCTPGSEIEFRLERSNPRSSDPFNPAYFAFETADGSGDADHEVVIPIAYPGEWAASFECDGGSATGGEGFLIPTPSDFAITAAVSPLLLGEAFEITVHGNLCAGTARWELLLPGRPPLATGSAAPWIEDPTWTSTGSGVIPADAELFPGGNAELAAWCEFPGGTVLYESNLIPVGGGNTGSTAPGGRPAPRVSPRFTG